MFVEPLILLLLGWIMGEGIGPKRIFACLAGFIGAGLFLIWRER